MKNFRSVQKLDIQTQKNLNFVRLNRKNVMKQSLNNRV